MPGYILMHADVSDSAILAMEGRDELVRNEHIR
jgi:hypothetical protein